MTTAAFAMCVFVGVVLDTGAASATPPTELILVDGQSASGVPNEPWLEALSVFGDAIPLDEIAATPRPYSEDELKWRALILDRAKAWPSRIEQLRAPFGDVRLPHSVVIVLGNIGGQDAFAPGDRMVAFDLSRLNAVYGSAESDANRARIDRFFDHEFTHLIHKAWRAEHQPKVETPLERALWIGVKEGIGNYYSLSARWTNEDGSLSAHAHEVLARLEPIFVDRISKLEHAAGEEAERLMEGISMGPFDQKWGALTVALWLTEEANGDETALTAFVAAGHWGVLELARRHVPAELAADLPARPQHVVAAR